MVSEAHEHDVTLHLQEGLHLSVSSVAAQIHVLTVSKFPCIASDNRLVQAGVMKAAIMFVQELSWSIGDSADLL